VRSSAALTAFALVLGWPLAGGVIGAVGLAGAGVMGWQLIRFGRLMHRIIELVAKQARLTSIERVSRARWEMRGWVRGAASKAVSGEVTGHTPSPAETPFAGD